VRFSVICRWYGEARATGFHRSVGRILAGVSNVDESGTSRFTIAAEPADSADARWCFEQYAAELGRLFGYELETSLPLRDEDLIPPRGLVILARDDLGPVGCGAVKLGQPGVAEIKRMWVSGRARGQGLGGRLLGELEARAQDAGKSIARLETNRHLTAAIAMYRNHGYHEVPAFNDEPFGDHWFEKELPVR
jgi:ribosomal protein S18 acetylase RimI-like enzyme